jgi:hypothetical protein
MKETTQAESVSEEPNLRVGENQQKEVPREEQYSRQRNQDEPDPYGPNSERPLHPLLRRHDRSSMDDIAVDCRGGVVFVSLVGRRLICKPG